MMTLLSERDELLALAREVAETMEGYQVESGDISGWVVHLAGPGCARLSIRAESGRIVVRGMFPARTCYVSDYVITVRRDRGAEVIAREIARRLLPGYLPMLAQAIAAKAEDDARVARQAELVATFAELLPDARVHQGSMLGSMSFWFGPDINDGSGELHVDRSGQVSIDLRWLDLDTARKVVDVVRARAAELAGERDEVPGQLMGAGE